MSSCPETRRPGPRLKAVAAALALTLALPVATLAQGAFPGVGRPATPQEIAAWDIDVRPDFKGLPPGSGSVAKGMEVWEGKCASCHGIFGESNEIFSPLVGGTTAKDIQTGRVARLNDPAFPGRTTLMKVPTVSTLWDYINRAMPWTAPKTLSVEEVYAVTAYLLHLGGVLPDDFVMSDKNIAEVQARLPNRNGMTTDHSLWPGGPGKGGMGTGQPDVKAVACMRNCATEPRLASFLPDFARNAHGNLAQQNRLVGAQRGANTDQPAPASAAAAAAAPTSARAAPAAPAPGALAVATLNKNGCMTCHGMANKIVGPGFAEVARKYSSQTDAQAYLAGKIKSGGQGVWGVIPMPAQALSESDAKMLAEWLAQGAPQ